MKVEERINIQCDLPKVLQLIKSEFGILPIRVELRMFSMKIYKEGTRLYTEVFCPHCKPTSGDVNKEHQAQALARTIGREAKQFLKKINYM